MSAFSNYGKNGNNLEAGLTGVAKAFKGFGSEFSKAWSTSGGNILSSMWNGLGGFVNAMGPAGQIMTVVAGLSAAVTIGVKAYDHFHKSTEELIEDGQAAQSAIEDINNAYQETADTVDSIDLETYTGYMSKVNPITNENAGLTTDEYQEYLDISNQLGELFPTLISGFDSQGNYMLNLSSNTEEASDALSNLLDQERNLANYKISEQLQDVANGLVAENGQLEAQIEDYEKLVEARQEALDQASTINEGGLPDYFTEEDFGNDSWEFRFEIATESVEEFNDATGKFREALDKADINVPLQESSDEMLGMSNIVIEAANLTREQMDAVEEAYKMILEEGVSGDEIGLSEAETNLQLSIARQKALWSDIAPSLQAYVSSLGDFLKISEDQDTQDTLIDGINRMIGNFDLSDLGEEDLNAFTEDAKGWIIDKFVEPIVEAANDGKDDVVDAYADLFSLDISKMTIPEAKDTIDSLVETIFPEDEEAQVELKLLLGFDIETESGAVESVWRSSVQGIADRLGISYSEARDYFESGEWEIEDIELGYNIVMNNSNIDSLDELSEKVNELEKEKPISLSDIFALDEEGNNEFSDKVDTFQSDMESINSALDDLRNGEEVNVMDLVQDFPELANSLDNLEEGLSNLSIQKAQQFAKDWKEAFSNVGEEDMDAVNKLFNETIADVDMSSVINKSTDALERYNDVVAEARSHGIEDLTQTIWGNTDANNRQVIKWNEENLERFRGAIESMGDSVEDFAGSYSTVLGSMEEFDGVEIAFTPMLQTPNGAELLDSYTVSEYINEMIRQLGEGWTPEQLLALDATGLDINGKHIQNLISGIGDDAEVASWALHYLGDEGAIALEAMNNEVRDFALENMMNNMLEGTGGSALTHQADLLRDQFGDVLDEVFAEYGTDQYAVEAIARLSLNPQAANWDFDEWKAQIENEEIYVKINMYEDSIAQLENNLDLIETSAERVQNEMERNDIYARQNGEQMYRDLINNGNLQLENLKSQLAYWQAIAAEADTTATYANALSQIQSIESEINSVLSSQQEWNAAAEALKYEAGDLLSEYSEATSTRNGGDTYSEILSALDATNELVEEGKWGVDEAQAGLKLASAAGIADITNWEQNYAHMQRYFTEDATGISNALSDLTEATNDAGEALATYDEATGDWFVNINNPKDLEAAAQAWGLNTEAAYSLVTLLSDYDFGVGYIESEEDGLYQLGAAYADLAQKRYKLNQMEKDSDRYSEEEVKAQQDIVDKAEQTAQYFQDAVESWDQASIDEMNEAAYGELLSELNTLPEVYEKSGSEGMSAFLDGMKEFANENGLEVDDLFTTGPNGETLLSEEGYHALEERVGSVAEDISLSGNEAGGKFGEALVNSMGETIDEEGTTIQQMAESIAETYDKNTLDKIKFDTGEYTAGVEEAEMAVDGLLDALGLTQAEGEEAVKFLEDIQNGDWDSAMEFLTRAEEVQGEIEDYLYNPEVAAEVEPKVESALENQTPEELLGLTDEELAETLEIEYEVNEETGKVEPEVQQQLNEVRRELEGEELNATVNTVVESNEEIESAEDLLNLSPEELEVAFEPVLEGSDLDMSDIESYLGYEEPEIPMTVKIDEEQFGDLSALLNPEESVPVTAELEEGSVQSIEDELNGIEGTAHVSVEFGEGIEEGGFDEGSEPYSWQADETGTISIPATLNIQIEQSDLEEALNGEEETVTVKSEWEQAAAPQTEEIITETIDYETGTIEEPDVPTAEGTVDYEPGDIEEPEGVTTEGLVNYETGSVEQPDITTTDETVNVTTNVNDSGVGTLEGEINSLPDSKTVDVTVNAEPGEVSSLEGEVDSVNGKSVDVTANVNGTGEVQALKAAIDSVYSKTVQVTANVSGIGEVNALAGAIAAVQSKTVTVTTVTQTINGGSAGSVDTSGYATSGLDTGTQAGRLLGTAHVSGTAQGMRAYAGGGWNYWALPRSEKAIVNEIGNESIVILLRPHMVTCVENLSNCWETVKPIKL